MKAPVLKKNKNNKFVFENDFEFIFELPFTIHDPYTFEPWKKISFIISPQSLNEVSDEEYAELLSEKLKQDFKKAILNDKIKKK